MKVDNIKLSAPAMIDRVVETHLHAQTASMRGRTATIDSTFKFVRIKKDNARDVIIPMSNVSSFEVVSEEVTTGEVLAPMSQSSGNVKTQNQ